MGNKLRIHSYIVGNSPAHTDWKLVSCATQGTHGIIPEGTDEQIMDSLSNLNMFFHLDRNKGSEEHQYPYITEPSVSVEEGNDIYFLSLIHI